MAGNINAHIPTQPNSRNRDLQVRYVVKPRPPVGSLPDAGFIKNVASNFANPRKQNNYRNQDAAHTAIFTWLLTHTYHPSKVPDTDPFKAAYAKITPKNLMVPYYWIQPTTQVPIPQVSRFIWDFMQIQRDSITISGWVGSNAINDLAENSNLGKDFNRIVNMINEIIATINPNLRPQVFLFRNVAHRDAIQIIPNPRKGRQYAGTISESVKIDNNQITSAGSLQGIFASDGAFRKLTITNNTISTQGEHAISISGMLSGTVSGNRTPVNNPVKLLPLRIGGGHIINGNIYIIGFSPIPLNQQTNIGNNYWYEPIAGGQSGIQDFRQKIDTSPTPVIRLGKFYKDVNMAEFFRWRVRFGENYQAIMNQLVRTRKATFVGFVGAVKKDGVVTTA